jgi:hypothetical protein
LPDPLMPTLELNPSALLKRVRTQSPVVHLLTNWVTICDCAQVVKVLGASPVMAHAPEEVEEMARLAAQSAKPQGAPVILDVCGAGATSFAPLRGGAAAVICPWRGRTSEVNFPHRPDDCQGREGPRCPPGGRGCIGGADFQPVQLYWHDAGATKNSSEPKLSLL